MRIYTTPTHTLTINGISLEDYTVYVTYEQGKVSLTKSTPDDISIEVQEDDEKTVTTITVSLSQEDTAKFEADKKVQVQVNWIDGSGNRTATNIKNISIKDNLLRQVI